MDRTYGLKANEQSILHRGRKERERQVQASVIVLMSEMREGSVRDKQKLSLDYICQC